LLLSLFQGIPHANRIAPGKPASPIALNALPHHGWAASARYFMLSPTWAILKRVCKIPYMRIEQCAKT
jgi:hypothetical protein